MMIEYRKIDYKKDIPEIVSLLQTSLGENHNIQSFLWKHYENPFGRSYGLLACDGDKIVGVRMFMFWEFIRGETLLKAIRPVDTITHPEYRRKGIFKKLTLKGLENCKEDYDIIFNTPNDNSFSGYLKMGWKEYPKELNFKIGLIFPFHRTKKLKLIPIDQITIEQQEFDSRYFYSNISTEFIHWRYSNQEYKAMSMETASGTLYIIYRIRIIKGIKVILVTEIIGDRSYHGMALRSLSSELGVFIVYFLANKSTNLKFTFTLKRRSATVVYREDSLNIINRIIYSSGDLEGRL